MIANSIIIIVLIGFIIYGFVRGFLRQVIGVVGTVLAFVLAALLCGTLVEIIKNNTGIYASIADFFKKILPNIDKEAIEKYPAFLQVIFAPMMEDAASAVDTVSDTLTRLVLSFAAYLVILLVVKLLCIIVAMILDKIFERTALGLVNKLLGLILGLIKGVLLVSAILFLVELVLVPSTPAVAEEIESSAISKFLLDFNVYGWIFKLVGLV